MPEHVYMVWDVFDGVRSGIADFNGEPHYFESRFDEAADDFSELFDLKKIDAETLDIALDQWAIYRDWESKYHSSQVSFQTHPGHGGVDERYDELEGELKLRVAGAPRSGQAHAVFQPKQQQLVRPQGCLLDMEVIWS